MKEKETMCVWAREMEGGDSTHVKANCKNPLRFWEGLNENHGNTEGKILSEWSVCTVCPPPPPLLVLSVMYYTVHAQWVVFFLSSGRGQDPEQSFSQDILYFMRRFFRVTKQWLRRTYGCWLSRSLGLKLCITWSLLTMTVIKPWAELRSDGLFESIPQAFNSFSFFCRVLYSFFILKRYDTKKTLILDFEFNFSTTQWAGVLPLYL